MMNRGQHLHWTITACAVVAAAAILFTPIHPALAAKPPTSSKPVVKSFAIDAGAASTQSAAVALNNACSGTPTEYIASESPTFAGAVWQPYSTAPNFTLTPGTGIRTVYFKTRNAAGESAALTDGISLAAPGPMAIVYGTMPTTSTTVPYAIDLRVVNADGTNDHVLLPNADRSSVIGPHWSPDGQQVVFTGQPGSSPDRGIYAINVDGTGLRRLASLYLRSYNSPAWSPTTVPGTNDEWILFADYYEPYDLSTDFYDYDIFAVRPDGTGRVNLTHRTDIQRDERAPTWSPEAGRFAALTTVNGEFPQITVFQLGLTTDEYGNPVPTVVNETTYPCEGLQSFSLDWARAHDKIAYSYGASDGSRDVAVLDIADPTQPAIQVIDGGGAGWGNKPTWSPDDTQLAYFYDNRLPGNNHVTGIFTLNYSDDPAVAGTVRTRISSQGDWIYTYPDWRR